MKIFVAPAASLIGDQLAFLRDKTRHHDREKFRRALEKIGMFLAYDISKVLTYHQVSVETPLATAQGNVLVQQPVLATVLRAGLALHQGLLAAFPDADAAFVSAYRKHDAEEHFSIELGYIACPDLNGRPLIVSDPMLATGQSFVAAVKALLQFGTPSEIHLVAAFATQEGINFVEQHLPQITLWVAVIDPELNAQKYIVPGLGDAGDLAFGEKVQR